MEGQDFFTLEKNIIEPNADTLSVQFNLDDTHLAVGCSDSFVRIYSVTGHNIRNLNCKATGESPSITSIRWRPSKGMTQNVLFATTGDGNVTHWHATSGKLLSSFSLENTQILCSDIGKNGDFFALGCNDMSVKVYDENNKNSVCTFYPGRGNHLGHSNRIFAVKWRGEQCLVSGGWDNNVILWDLRSGMACGGVFGPHICGESIDFYEDRLYTGSYEVSEQLKVWDFRTFQTVRTLDLNVPEEKPCKVYSLQLQKSDPGTVLLGCTGFSQLLAIDSATFTKKGVISNTSSVFSLDFSQSSSKFAAVTTDRNINIYSYSS